MDRSLVLGWENNEQSHGRCAGVIQQRQGVSNPRVPFCILTGQPCPICLSLLWFFRGYPVRTLLYLSVFTGTFQAQFRVTFCCKSSFIFPLLSGLVSLTLCKSSILNGMTETSHPDIIPISPSSSLPQQQLLTERVLCALIISYEHSLSLSIKYL